MIATPSHPEDYKAAYERHKVNLEKLHLIAARFGYEAGVADALRDIILEYERLMMIDYARHVSKHFFYLPLEIRKRWWKETNYSAQPPSDQLRNEIDILIAKKEMRPDG